MKFTSDITVRLIQSVGGDHMVIAAARVSTSGEEAQNIAKENPEESRGLIRYLMQHRHGTPFEHGAMTFFVHAPIFVWREWHRHRVGFSYNEESGRYKTLDPVFYIPPRDRPIVKVEGWKPGRPRFITLDEYFADDGPGRWVREPTDKPENNGKEQADRQYRDICNRLKQSYRQSYETYKTNLKEEIDPGNYLELDPGLARDCLPVGIYSSCWVTCNPRSLMHFLSLRTHEPTAARVSYPLYEIEVAARACEMMLQVGWPITYAAFVDFGRVAP